MRDDEDDRLSGGLLDGFQQSIGAAAVEMVGTIHDQHAITASTRR